MSVELLVFTPDEWANYSEDCHAAVFREIRKRSLDRITFALAVLDAKGPIGYVTCRETDEESIYWQYGGAIESRYGVAAFRGFEAFIEYTEKRYRRITTLVKNDNIKYLHLLMKFGFRIIGLRCFKEEIFLELLKEV